MYTRIYDALLHRVEVYSASISERELLLEIRRLICTHFVRWFIEVNVNTVDQAVHVLARMEYAWDQERKAFESRTSYSRK